MSLSRFVALWTHPHNPPDPVSEADLRTAELRLNVLLPADYRDAVLTTGLPRPNIDLLDTIVERSLDLRDASAFLNPSEIVSMTEDWRDLGLPEELVAFATDCMGNLFCFPAQGGDSRAAAAPVFCFDHDERHVEVVAPSFTAWIEDFCRLAPH